MSCEGKGSADELEDVGECTAQAPSSWFHLNLLIASLALGEAAVEVAVSLELGVSAIPL